MRAALLLSPHKVEITESAWPRPAEDEVLIKPALLGICGSDVSLFLGHRKPPEYPLRLGHEVFGTVIGRGERASRVAVGQRVIVEPNFPCGVCKYCRAGRSNICPNKKSFGVTVPGAAAEHFAVPVEFVWPVPDGVSEADAVTIEPLAVSLHALWQSEAQGGDTIAVLGCGATGLLLVHAAVAHGMRVLAYDRLEAKVLMAQRLGAQVEHRSNLAEWFDELGVTTIFECAGAAATVEMALGSVPRGGQVVLLGLSASPASFVPLKLVREEIRVSGSIIYDHPGDFARAISLVQEKRLSPGSIITNTLPFTEISRALELASTGEVGKIVLDMSG